MSGSSSGEQQQDEQHIAGRGMAADCSGSSSMQQAFDSLDSEELLLSEAEVRGLATCNRSTSKNLPRVEPAPTAITQPQEVLEDGPERALLVLSRDNPIRRAAAAVVTNAWFERFILALVSCWQGSNRCCLPPDGSCHMATPTHQGVVSDRSGACRHCTTAVDPCQLRHPRHVQSGARV